MHKKTASILAMVVALGGFALAVFIPAASAEKGHATYTEYCENGTNTVYSEYNQYCETTTTVVNNGTTTVVTSPVTTPITTTTGTTTGTAAPQGVTIGANGVATIDVGKLTPGETFTINGVTVKVLAYTANGVEVSFDGTTVDIPDGATVEISTNGIVYVSYSIVNGKVGNRVAAKVVGAVTRQYEILPTGRTASTVSYTLPKGVSFGAKTTWAQIAKSVTVYTLGKKAVKVPLKVSANKARTSIVVKFAKSEKTFVLYFNTAKLQYTKAESTTIAKKKIKTLAPKFTLTSKFGSKSTKNVFSYKYPV